LVLGTEPVGQRLRVLVAGAVAYSYFGAFLALVAALPYGAALFAWSLLSRRVDLLERSPFHVAAFTALLALPTAIIVSFKAADFVGQIRWGEALRVFPTAFLVPWGALTIPRVAIHRLKPGAFREPSSCLPNKPLQPTRAAQPSGQRDAAGNGPRG